MTHEIKCRTEYFKAIRMGYKTFEIRKNDRDYKLGDKLLLKEWDNVNQKYTNMEQEVDVIYILYGGQFGIEEGYVVMSIN
jgi:hypothetical protein